MRMKIQSLVSLGLFLLTAYFVHSFFQAPPKDVKARASYYGIPVYTDARPSASLSSPAGNPAVAAFLSDDNYDKIVAFYIKELNLPAKKLNYGGRSVTTMTIYQFEIKKGILRNQIEKGVEIIPLNTWNQRLFKAKTKIKIFIPQAEIKAQ